MIEWVFCRAIGEVQRGWKSDTGCMLHMIGASRRVAGLASCVTRLLATAALVGSVGISAPAAAQVPDQPPAVSAYTLTPERIAASLAAVMGLSGAVIGGLALARSAVSAPAPAGAGRSWPWRWGRSAWSSVGWSWRLPTVVSALATGWPAVSSV